MPSSIQNQQRVSYISFILPKRLFRAYGNWTTLIPCLWINTVTFPPNKNTGMIESAGAYHKITPDEFNPSSSVSRLP